jgi:HEAT repeat protein
MAKSSTTKEKLLKLGKLKDVPLTTEVMNTFKRSLTSANNIIVEEAAKIVGERGIEEFVPFLLKAFDRFGQEPEKKDKGCLAKEAIIEALDTMEYDQEKFFLQGIKYFQIEPGYPKSVDTAAVLRGKCAFALVRLGYSEAVFELVDLLNDPEPQARIAAVRALTGISSDQSEPLLRLKTNLGDTDHQVISECLSALMLINPERSLEFVERFLNSDDFFIAQSAAFALGESRREDAFNILRRYREKTNRYELYDMLLTPMAITRLEEAFIYLINVIEKEEISSALAAVKAIQIFCDESHRVKIQDAVYLRNNTKLAKAYEAWQI